MSFSADKYTYLSKVSDNTAALRRFILFLFIEPYKKKKKKKGKAERSVAGQGEGFVFSDLVIRGKIPPPRRFKSRMAERLPKQIF